MMAMQILYFAWLRERIGLSEERVEPPAGTVSVADLVGWLRSRGVGYAEALADTARVRCAVNQDFATPEAAVADGDEIAFFPPITGG
jgi:molybdopterin synthase sulfur carrier subunit